MTTEMTPHLNGVNVNADRLWELVQETWERVADSMPDRLQEVVQTTRGTGPTTELWEQGELSGGTTRVAQWCRENTHYTHEVLCR